MILWYRWLVYHGHLGGPHDGGTLPDDSLGDPIEDPSSDRQAPQDDHQDDSDREHPPEEPPDGQPEDSGYAVPERE